MERQSHPLTNLRLPPDTKMDHFGYVLSSQSLGIVLKKLNLTQQKQTTHKNKIV